MNVERPAQLDRESSELMIVGMGREVHPDNSSSTTRDSSPRAYERGTACYQVHALPSLLLIDLNHDTIHAVQSHILPARGKTISLSNRPSHDVLHWSKQPSERLRSQRGDSQFLRSRGSHRSLTVLTIQESELSKVVSFVVRLDDSLARRTVLDRDRVARFDEEELFTRLAFSNDVLAFGECAGFEDVGDLGSLLRLQRGEDGDFRKEGLVQASLSGCMLGISSTPEA